MHKRLLGWVACLWWMGCQGHEPVTPSAADQGAKIAVTLQPGGGYFDKPTALEIMQAVGMADVDSLEWTTLLESDKIGKYVPNGDPGGYIACIEGKSAALGDPLVVLELQALHDDSARVVAKERYFQGNYNCCWRTIDQGFRGQNGYALLDICGTGSNICEAHTFIFQHLQPQDSLDALNTMTDAWWEADHSVSTTELHVDGDKLTINYTDSIGTMDEARKWVSYRVEQYAVTYLRTGHRWRMQDTLRAEADAKP